MGTSLPPPPSCLPAAAAHVALNTTIHTLIHTYVGIQKRARTSNTQASYLQRMLCKHTCTQTETHWSELSGGLILQIKAMQRWIEIHFFFFLIKRLFCDSQLFILILWQHLDI